MRWTRSLKSKLITNILITAVPLLAIIIYLVVSLYNYSASYDRIVDNMTVANQYNINFEEDMDESIYKLVVSNVPVEDIDTQSKLVNPYNLIDELRDDFSDLSEITTDPQSQAWLQSLLRNIDTLEDRVDDIDANLVEGGHYDENIEMLDDNIYILTELIQEDIQYYIYYQTETIDALRNSLNQRINNFLLILIAVIFVVVLLVFITSTKITSSITVPIANLCTVTEQISEGNFTTRADIGTDDEIRVLADSINSMSANLEEMVEQIKEDQQKLQHAELRLLQEQINPHFLYNTLDTIVWLIESNRTEEAEEMVMSLSTFFRLVLSHGRAFIPIRDEEKHIRSYLEIQQVRYSDILDYEIAIDEELGDYEILKMTLQPLVENALYHGIKYKRAKGTIRIRGSKIGEDIRLIVSDDGVGMELAELRKLQAEIQKPCADSEKGFGLANVNERIRMRFGADYGIFIDSEPGQGTSVTVRIPAIRYEREEEKENA